MKKMVLFLFPPILSYCCCPMRAKKKTDKPAIHERKDVINPLHTILERSEKYGPEDFEKMRRDLVNKDTL